MKTLLISLVLAFVAFGQQTQSARIVICTDAGTTDDYACTPNPPVTSYTTGLHVRVYAATVNTGPATINLSALGVKSVKRKDGTDPANGDIKPGNFFYATYDGTNFQMDSQLGNVSAGGGTGGSTFMTSTAGGVVAQGTTAYFGAFFSTAETSSVVSVPRAGIIKSFAIHLSTAQPASHTLTCTVRKALAATAWGTAGTDDPAVQVVIAAGAAAGVYSDYTGSVAFALGDKFSIGCAQQAGTLSSATIRAVSWEFE